MSEGTAVATRPTRILAATGGVKIRGLEGGDSSDIAIPSITLLQGLSRPVQEGFASAGQYFNFGTNKIVKDPVFIPVLVTKYFDAFHEENGKRVLDFRTFDPQDERLEERQRFNDKKTGKKADVNQVVAVLALLDGSPVIIRFKSTSLKAARKLVTAIAMAGTDAFANAYKLKSAQESKNDRTYWIMDIEELGPVSQEEFLPAESLYNSFHGRYQTLYNMAAADDGTEEVHVARGLDQVAEDVEEIHDEEGNVKTPPKPVARTVATEKTKTQLLDRPEANTPPSMRPTTVEADIDEAPVCTEAGCGTLMKMVEGNISQEITALTKQGKEVKHTPGRYKVWKCPNHKLKANDIVSKVG